MRLSINNSSNIDFSSFLCYAQMEKILCMNRKRNVIVVIGPFIDILFVRRPFLALLPPPPE